MLSSGLDKVVGIIQDNPGSNLLAIKQLIQDGMTIIDKDIHRNLAEKNMKFDGNVGADANALGGQRSIGTG